MSGIAPSPDGRWLAVAVQRLDREGTKYVSDLWKVPTDGGPAVQLTRGEAKDHSPAFRHDGALAFLSNRQPNEVKHDENHWILKPRNIVAWYENVLRFIGRHMQAR